MASGQTKPANVPQPVVAAKVNAPANFSCDSFKIPATVCLWERSNANPSNNLLITIDGTFKNGQQTGTAGYSYVGDGLQSGDCGLQINNVKEDDSAQWTCTLIGGSGTLRGTVIVGILKKPDPPQFLQPLGRLNDGDEKSVTCFSTNGQPAPTFQWFIDDTPVDAAQLSDIRGETKNGVTATVQQMKYKYTWQESGKKVRCLTVSEALSQEDPRETSMPITIDYSPRAAEHKVNVKVPELGSQAVLAINISANPDPRIHWMVGNVRVNPRFKTPDQKYEARAVKQVDRELYLCELVINTVEEEDLNAVYKLVAENQIGTGHFELRLSSDSGPGGGLSAAGIVGLVLGIPVILILIALVVVYTRAKGLLCFKGDDGTSSEKERMGPPP